jgi:hypothetical protein
LIYYRAKRLQMQADGSRPSPQTARMLKGESLLVNAEIAAALRFQANKSVSRRGLHCEGGAVIC